MFENATLNPNPSNADVLRAVSDLNKKIELYQESNNYGHEDIKKEIGKLNVVLAGDGVDPTTGMVVKLNGLCDIVKGNGKKGLIKQVEQQSDQIKLIVAGMIFLLYAVKDIIVGWIQNAKS